MYTIPAGKYWVGDPCYSFSKSWLQVLEESDYFKKPYCRADGTPIAVAFNTAYGDGCYDDQTGFPYPVDAGLIGLVLVGAEEYQSNGVRMVEFPAEVRCYVREEQHTIVFEGGDVKIEIETDPDFEEPSQSDDEEEA